MSKTLAPQEAISRLCTLLSRGRYRLGDEKRCQSDIEDLFTHANVGFEREYELSEGVVDFFLPKSGIAIEVKVNKGWRKLAVYRQCERYCRDPNVKGVLLATGQAQGLPDVIAGKPAGVFLLSQCSL